MPQHLPGFRLDHHHQAAIDTMYGNLRDAVQVAAVLDLPEQQVQDYLATKPHLDLRPKAKRGRRARPLDPQRAIELRRQGMSVRRIAGEMGVAVGRVRQVLEDNNALEYLPGMDGRSRASKSQGPGRDLDLVQVAKLYYEQRWSEKAIAAELGALPGDIRRILREHGLPLR